MKENPPEKKAPTRKMFDLLPPKKAPLLGKERELTRINHKYAPFRELYIMEASGTTPVAEDNTLQPSIYLLRQFLQNPFLSLTFVSTNSRLTINKLDPQVFVYLCKSYGFIQELPLLCVCIHKLTVGRKVKFSKKIYSRYTAKTFAGIVKISVREKKKILTN